MLVEELENVLMELIYLLNTDPKNAFKLASELDQFNKERQMLEKDLLQKILNETKDYSNDPVLVLSGIIGMKE